jgi:hypothetical protein
MFLMASRPTDENKLSVRSTAEVMAALNFLRGRLATSALRDHNGRTLKMQAIVNSLIMYADTLRGPELDRVMRIGLAALERKSSPEDDPQIPARQVGKVVDPPPERSALTVRPVPEPPAKRRPKARSKKKKGDEM